MNLSPICLPIPPLSVDTEPLFEFPDPYSKFPLAIYFTYGNVSFRVTLSIHLTLPSPFPMAIKSIRCLFLHCCPVNKFFSTMFLDSVYMCSVQFSHPVVSDSLRPQARILDWVAISYSRGSSQPRDQTCISCISCIGGWILYHLGSLKVSLLLTITNVTTRRVLSTHPWH